MGDYRALVALPLLASLAAVALAAAATLLRGAPVGLRALGARWGWWVLLVALVFLAANQLLVRGVGVGTWDADGQFLPYYVIVADHARAARFLQWDPWSSGGLPLLGDPQVGAFSPLNILLGLVTGGTSAGFRLYWLLLWWLGGLGMLMLGRHLGAPTWGSAAVALGFLFCGAYTGNAEHTSWVVALSFLPLTIWRLDVALGSGRRSAACQAGAIWGLSALSGYPGIVMMTGCLAAVWALGRSVFAAAPVPRGEPLDRSRPRLLAAATAVGLMLLVGLAVLAPTYVAFFAEGAAASSRVGALERAVALSNSLDPGALATFASPYLPAIKVFRQFTPGYEAAVKLWPATDPSMVNIYAGPIVPVLALYALLRRPRDGWRWWIAAIAVLSLGCALGETLPLRGWLYDVFYPTRFFRHAAMFRLYFLFALSVLALLASRDLAADLADDTGSGRSRLPLAAIVAAAAAAFAFLPFAGDAWNHGMPAAAVLLGRGHMVFAWLGIVALAALAWRLPGRAARWSVPVLLVAFAAGDALLTSVLSIPTTTRVGEAAARWRELDARHRPGLELTGRGLARDASGCVPEPAGRCRRNDQLITKAPAFNAYTTDKNPYHQVMIEDPVLKGAAIGAERIWFAERVAEVPPTDAAFAELRRRADELGAPPIVVHAPEALLHRDVRSDSASAASLDAIATLPAATRIETRVTAYRPGELGFRVRVPSAGWLLVTDRWARGWRAEVDGRAAPVYGGNFIFRAVRLPGGAHRVRFVYRPAGYPWLLLLSWGTLLAVAVVTLSSGRAHVARAP